MTVPEPLVVWRGLRLPEVAQTAHSLVDDEIEEIAFVSTSLLRDVALEHLREQAADGEGVLERIHVPGGAQAAIAVHAAAPDLIDDVEEAELLLPRGTHLRVRDDVRTLQLEVIS